MDATGDDDDDVDAEQMEMPIYNPNLLVLMPLLRFRKQLTAASYELVGEGGRKTSQRQTAIDQIKSNKRIRIE